ncbi:N-acetyltransferase family protein [Peribacillus simplex]|uniref:GNAT family N-acetyltransferase n=1 Tax=Peribacillus simplex TaxID=1478 RepID=UPI003D2C1096
MIRQMKLTDLDAVLTIYGEGVKTGCATFETTVPSKEKWNSSHHKTLRFVAEAGEQVVGFAINKPSITLHKKMGFRTVGTRGHDTVIMERRSENIF